TFSENASDADGDTLTYQWAYQTPGSSTWVNFSTVANPTKVLNIKGTWDIRLTVTDSSSSTASVTKYPVVVNRAPVADFTYSPTTIYNDTTVAFNENASDADGDTLTYQWAYQTPGSSTWVNFSIAANPSKVLNIKGTWDIRLTVTDSSGATASKTKNPVVVNRPPVADFNFSPATIYNDTTVTFTNASVDADNDTLTYQWAYQQPGTSTWTNFSTAVNPTRVLNVKGTWGIRLTVTDVDGATATKIKNPVVVNRPPVADFNFSPTTIYNDTNVTFTNASSDADGDSLTYQWAYQQPGSSTWTNFSSVVNPTRVLNIKGTWGIRLTVTDVDGATATKIKNPVVVNRPSTITVTYSPADPYEGDTINICATASDLDNDPLLVKIFVKKDSGIEQTVLNKSNVVSGTQKCYSFTSQVGRYDVRATVHDGTVEVGTSTWFYSKPLIIKGYVKHTADWLLKHQEQGHSPNQFYSGEKFLLEADTSPYPIVYVRSTLIATQANGNPHVKTVGLTPTTNVFAKGELYDPAYLEYPTNLKVGTAAFEFEVKYANGVIKKDRVPIEIIDDVYNAYKLHRTY
ncbi:PKD domain-containing protein, partial [Fictibacillus phosphorivorans]|uniref:PKD domain-containing protein n=1 Tax=Fictibacillus phosphorivorans TaxID=1221500 RepID=UPI000A59518D